MAKRKPRRPDECKVRSNDVGWCCSAGQAQAGKSTGIISVPKKTQPNLGPLYYARVCVCVCAQTLQMTVPDWGATIRQQSSQLRVKSTSQRSWYSVSSKVRDGVVHIFLVVLMIGDAATRKGSALDRPRFCCPAGASISSVARVACSVSGQRLVCPVVWGLPN